MLDIFKAIILGIIEGVTEFLPISSTGHLYLADYIIKLDQPSSFINMFMVVIQLGAILSVIVIYFNKLNPLPRQRVSGKKARPGRSGSRSSWPSCRQSSSACR